VVYWYDNIWHSGPTLSKCFRGVNIGLIKDQFLFAMGNFCTGLDCQFVKMLDVSSQSPCWIPMMDMSVSRKSLIVCSLNNCMYAVSLVALIY